MTTALATITDARSTAARFYVSAYRNRAERNRRDRYTPDVLLAAWVAWEGVRDTLARIIADDLAAGFDFSRARDLEAYRVARDRVDLARERYVAAHNARRAAV